MKRTIKIFIIILILIVVASISYYTYIMLTRNIAEVAMFGTWDEVERMINNDADVNAKIRSNYAFINSIKMFNDSEIRNEIRNNDIFEKAKYLYEFSLFNARVLSEWSVLMMACVDGKKEIVELLIEKGADVNEESFNFGTPIIIATRSENIEIVQMLIDNGADINAVREFSNLTSLQYATLFGNYEMAKLLIENGADVDLCRSVSQSPIILSIKQGHFGIAKLIYPNIAKFNYSNDIRLIISSYVGDLDEVKELVLDKKTDPNTNTSLSPLCVAIESENLEIIDFLIDEGADPNIKNDNLGMSAKDYAKEKGIELD